MKPSQLRPYLLTLGLALTGCAVDLTPVTATDSADAGPPSRDPIAMTSNGRGTNHDYFYTFWKDSGSVTMTLPSPALVEGEVAGHFSVSWVGGPYNFVGGKGWNPGSSTKIINYDCTTWTTGSSNAYLTLYGWTREPLVEYYVVDSWGSWRPPGGTSAGRVTTDTGTYDLYKTRRTNAPNITGENADFEQYWSVRSTKKTMPSGPVAIDFAKHVEAWAAEGWQLGTHDYQVLATEVFNPDSSGSSDCTIW